MEGALRQAHQILLTKLFNSALSFIGEYIHHLLIIEPCAHLNEVRRTCPGLCHTPVTTYRAMTTGRKHSTCSGVSKPEQLENTGKAWYKQNMGSETRMRHTEASKRPDTIGDLLRVAL